jgi:hypothetical protein
MSWTFYNSSGQALTSLGDVALVDIDIDGGTDIGAAIVDADLLIIDDGAGGTNRKTAASRIKTYVGASLILINSVTAAGDASDTTLTITGLSTTYKSYLITGVGLTVVDDNATLHMRLGDSGGIDSGSTDYSFHDMHVRSDTSAYGSQISTGLSSMFITPGGIGNAAGEGGSFSVVLDSSTAAMSKVHGTWVVDEDAGGELKGGLVLAKRDAVITVTQVEIHLSSGNFDGGTLTVWGLKHD